MDYIFGSNDLTGKENLKTVGREHTDFSGFQQIVREYPDCVITDSFYVVKKTRTGEDTENNCYDWYEIDHHNRVIDKTKAIGTQIDALIAFVLED